jgi:hypothetical protein
MNIPILKYAKRFVEEPLRWRALIVSVVVIVVVLAVIQNIRVVAPFGTCEYCERITDCRAGAYGSIAQPVNAISNLAYLFLAIVVFRNRRRFGAWWLMIACAILCIGSTWFHAQPSQASHLGDLAGMFAVFVFLASYAVFASHQLGKYWLATLIAIFISAVLIITLNPATSSANPVIIPTALVMFIHVGYGAIKKIQSWKNAILVVAVFVVAYLARQLDAVSGICNPDSLIQLHAIWHVLTATGIMMAFVYFDDMRSHLHRGTP